MTTYLSATQQNDHERLGQLLVVVRFYEKIVPYIYPNPYMGKNGKYSLRRLCLSE